MNITNDFTTLLGIEKPIVQGGMMWVGRAELAAAASNAGGLGILTALTFPTPDDLKVEIERCRKMTSKPFGVNLTMLPSRTPPPYEEYCQAIIDSGVKIVETAGYNPGKFIEMLKNAGITVLHKCTAVRHAVSAEKLGVDVISIDGFECAGHPGEDDVPGLILIPAAVDAVKIPVIGSGGFGDGRGLAAALTLGAQGINMGTRFCATVEAPIHDNIKQHIVNTDERGTNLIFRNLGNTARCSKTDVSDEVVRRLQQPEAKFEDVAELVAGVKGRAALESGDITEGLVWAGQVQGLIHDIPTCADLLTRIVEDAAAILKRQAALVA